MCRSMRKALIAVASVFLLSQVCVKFAIAQQQGFSASSLLSQSSIAQWTSDNGLISNNITSAIRDHRGFIWITSYNGIFRFDGIQTYIYDKTKIPFLFSEAIYTVYEDKQGTLWFSTQTSGILRYRNNKFESIDPTNKVLPKSVRCLLIKDDGTVWVGTNNSGLYKIQNDKVTRVDCKALNDISILEIATDSNNNLWIATDGRGLYKYDGNKFQNIPSIPSKIVNSVYVSKNNTILVGTPDGLDIIENSKAFHYSKLIGFQVNKVICDKYNRVWVGTELGLARFTLGDSNSFAHINEDDGFPLSRINFLHYDEENSLWISTGRDGLIQLRETNIVNITPEQGLSNNKVNMVYEGPDKSFYVGCDGGTVDVYKQGKITELKFQTPLKDSGIRDIFQDKDGNLWIASYRGVIKKSKNKEQLFGIKEGLSAEDMRRILPGDNGDLWFGSRSGGVMKFNNGKVVALYDKKHELLSNYILALEKDKQGNIYVGTHSGGMNIIRKDGKVETFHIEADDSGILIFNIHIDDLGRVWTIGNTGLLYFDGKKFNKVLLHKELTGEIFFDWVEDLLGNVWITSNLGMIKIKKNDIDRFLKKEIPEVNFKLFDNRDGMKSKECTSATRALLSSTGKIWVPTIHGISVFYPEKSVENKIPPPVYITSLLTDNHEVEGSQPFTIRPGKLRYTFNYTAPSFVVPEKIKFKYKLENVDGDWIDAGTTRQAEYTNLSPGDYVFRVVACNNDGVWNEKGDTIRFNVVPFFYQTWTFYSLVIVSIGVLFYGIYKWRVNEIEKRNAELRKVNGELDRFVYSASHDLRAPLASVLGLVNVARLDHGKNFDNYLSKIETSVLKLDGFIRDIIDFSRNARVEIETEPIEFKTLINEIIDNLIYLDEKDQIRRIVKVEGEGAFYSDKKRLSIVLNNIISNAIKYYNQHASDSFIEVAVKYDQKQAVLEVKDNGIGIGKEHIGNIFKMFYRGDSKSRGSGIGLYIVKETLDKIRGKVTVQSEYGRGSIFTIVLEALKTS